MPSGFAAVRAALTPHRHLLRDLLLILITSLVCFLYFSEQWLNDSRAQRQQSLNALALQLADACYVPLAANNLVSLNVLAHQITVQAPVIGVRIERLDQTVASSAGESQGMQAQAAIGDDEQKIIGQVLVFGEPAQPQPIWPFVLLLLCLLGLRAALTFFWQQLVPMTTKSLRELRERGQQDKSVQAALPPLLELPKVEARLDLSVVNYERLQQRFTPSALAQLLTCYDELIAQVAQVYGASCEARLPHASLSLKHSHADEAVFLLTCCAKLLQSGWQQLNQQRHDNGESCLSVQLLLSVDAPAALRQRVQQTAPADQLQLLLAALSEELQSRFSAQLLEQWQDHDDQWQLLTQVRLAERYQKLIDAQLETAILKS